MPTANQAKKGAGGSGTNGGNGHPYGNGHGNGHKKDLPLAKIGFWLFLGALTAMFGALVSTYLYRIGDKPNYAFAWPSTLWLSTIAIIASSFTLWMGQRSVTGGQPKLSRVYLGLTVALGTVFVIVQLLSWAMLARSGVYAQTNPFAGLFFILTAVHGLHLLGGIAWLIYLYYLAKFGELRARKHLALDLGAAYWHFMMVVWLVFFVLIVI